jgi:hypothetical protein
MQQITNLKIRIKPNAYLRNKKLEQKEPNLSNNLQ